MAGFTLLNAQIQKGKASYYSKRATGSRTASGERLHHDSLTCAHKSYPFGSLLRVTNLTNGKTVDVKVTDRGPYGRGRIIDLSYGAAREIGMLSQGVVLVEVKLLPGKKAPYRFDEEMNIPDFEFDFTESGYSFLEQFKDNDGEEIALPMAPDSNDKPADSQQATAKASTQQATAKAKTQQATHTKTTVPEGQAAQKSTQQKQATAKKQTKTTRAEKLHDHEPNKEPEDASSWRNVFEKIQNMF